MIERPIYLDYTVTDREWEDRWEYREFRGYPPGDADEEDIMAFIEDAKEAEKAIQEELVESGESKKTAYRMSCQWPLVDDAPMDAKRNFIGYMHDLYNPRNAKIDM